MACAEGVKVVRGTGERERGEMEFPCLVGQVAGLV